jgi:hypothetical protein
VRRGEGMCRTRTSGCHEVGDGYLPLSLFFIIGFGKAFFAVPMFFPDLMKLGFGFGSGGACTPLPVASM